MGGFPTPGGYDTGRATWISEGCLCGIDACGWLGVVVLPFEPQTWQTPLEPGDCDRLATATTHTPARAPCARAARGGI